MNISNTVVRKDLFSRPADENFDSMEDLLEQATTERKDSREIRIGSDAIKFTCGVDRDLRLFLQGREVQPLTHYSLTQVASMAKIPVQMIERLYKKDRKQLIVDNLAALFPNSRYDMKTVLIRDHKNSDGITTNSEVRAVNGSAYSRLWDEQVFVEMDDFLMHNGFTPDIDVSYVRNQFMYGHKCALYRGDQSSFGFFFVKEPDENLAKDLGGLCPGMMVWNSEVGARSFGFHTFYYHKQPGSIIIWTPSKHKRKRFVHRGDISKGFKEYLNVLEDTADNFEERFASDVAIFQTAATTPFADTHDNVIKKLRESFDVPAKEAIHLANSINHANNLFGDSRSVWNVALTIAREAGMTSRAEVMIDNSMLATKVIRKCLKV